MKINYLTLMVTTYCTLRCAQCALSIPRIDSAHYPFNDIKQSLVRAFSLYDYVEEFMISGGEAILHPQIIKIIHECAKYKKQYGILKFYTNATILPDYELLKCLANNCVTRIDDYGKYSKAKEWGNLCKGAGIPYETRDYSGGIAEQWQGGWVDIVGERNNRGYTDEELRQIFAECQNRTNGRFIWNGRLWACGNCAGMVLSKSIPDFGSDYIDLLDDRFDHENCKNKIMWETRPFLNACRYCNGFLVKRGRRIPAAVQIGE